ncbi:MAG TPA: hypothetical protein ENI33_04845 [Thermoplasmatales archaeon]|nr:hypothetical protein [Thermoplasmatales archaeon]
MKKEYRLKISEYYEVVVKINPDVEPHRPIYDAEIAIVLIEKGENGKREIFHISNYHWNDRLGGHPTTKKSDKGRKIFLNLSEGENSRRMSFESLKKNFIDETCSRIGEEYRGLLDEKLAEIKLGELK